jgi:hypothetical protein
MCSGQGGASGPHYAYSVVPSLSVESAASVALVCDPFLIFTAWRGNVSVISSGCKVQQLVALLGDANPSRLTMTLEAQRLTDLYARLTQPVPTVSLTSAIAVEANASNNDATWRAADLVLQATANTAAGLVFSAASVHESGPAVPPLQILVATTMLWPVLVRATVVSSGGGVESALNEGSLADSSVYAGVRVRLIFAVVSGAVAGQPGGSLPQATWAPVGNWSLTPHGQIGRVGLQGSAYESMQCTLQVHCSNPLFGAEGSHAANVDATGAVTLEFMLAGSGLSVCVAWADCTFANGVVSSALHLFRAQGLTLQLDGSNTTYVAVPSTTGNPVPFARQLSFSVGLDGAGVLDVTQLQDFVCSVGVDSSNEWIAGVLFCPAASTCVDGSAAQVSAVGGRVVFTSPVLLAADSGSVGPGIAALVATCVRMAGDVQQVIAARIAVPYVGLSVKWWPDPVASAPSAAFLGTPQPVRVRVQQALQITTNTDDDVGELSIRSYDPVLFGGLLPRCQLQVRAISSPTAAANNTAGGDLELSGVSSDPEGSWAVREAGVAELQLTVTGSYGAGGWVSVVCSVAGTIASSTAALVTLLQMQPYLESAVSASQLLQTDVSPAMLPLLALPSSEAATLAVLPPPAVMFLAAAPGVATAHIFQADPVCVVEAAAANASAVVSASGSATVVDVSPGYTWSAASNATLLTALFVQPQWPHWGVEVLLALVCKRRVTEALPRLVWSVVTPNVSAAWYLAPPAAAVSGEPFTAVAHLHFWAHANQASQPALADFARLLSCSLDGTSAATTGSVSVLADDATQPGITTGVESQAPVQFAIAVNFSQAQIQAPAGAQALLRLRCAVGSIVLPSISSLPTVVTCLGCPVGQSPAGDGSLCAPCPTGSSTFQPVAWRRANTSISTGSITSLRCEPCPRTGVRCAPGQPPVLLPGYYPANSIWLGDENSRVMGSSAATALAVQLTTSSRFVGCPRSQLALLHAPQATEALSAVFAQTAFTPWGPSAGRVHLLVAPPLLSASLFVWR